MNNIVSCNLYQRQAIIFVDKYYIFQPFDQNEDVPIYYRTKYVKPITQPISLFSYIKGMDKFKDDASASRKEIYEALEKIRSVQQVLPNSVMFKIFFNAKRDELINIFKQAEPGMKNRSIELLRLLDPSNATNYDKIN